MVKFIYACMGVVALSVLSIGGQYLFSGLGDSYQSVLDRNNDGSGAIAAATVEPATADQIAQDEITAEALNAIESAAGGAEPANGNGEFGARFRDAAPKALEDSAPIATPTAQTGALD